MNTELTTRSLPQLEGIIEQGLQTFVEVGNALVEIRERNLYKEAGYTSFDTYCQERWDFKRAHAYRLMDAAHVSGLLSPIGDIANEAQARELAKLKDDDVIVETYRELKEEHGDKLTAKVIREAVNDHMHCKSISDWYEYTIAKMSEYGEVSSVGWQLRDDLTFEEWLETGEILKPFIIARGTRKAPAPW